MIYPLAGLILGCLTGLVMARQRGGNGKDLAQWGAVLGLIGFLVGMLVLIFIERSFT